MLACKKHSQIITAHNKQYFRNHVKDNEYFNYG